MIKAPLLMTYVADMFTMSEEKIVEATMMEIGKT